MLTEPTTLAELVARLVELGGMLPVERAREARRLDNTARAILADVGDAAVYEATRDRSLGAIAAELGVSRSRVNGAITRHNRRAAKRTSRVSRKA
jgi:hypothetical protein